MDNSVGVSVVLSSTTVPTLVGMRWTIPGKGVYGERRTLTATTRLSRVLRARAIDLTHFTGPES